MTRSVLGESAGPTAIPSELAQPASQAPARPPDARPSRQPGGTSLRVGVATLWLSVIVLLPLAAIAWQAVGGGRQAFWLAVTSHAALESFRVTLTISVLVTVVNVVLGLLTAWVLVRDDFVGKGLIDAVIDLPFALPTIVTSLVMLALYGKKQSGGAAPAAHPAGSGDGVRVRHLAVHRSRRAAGTAGARSRSRGGGGRAGRHRPEGVHFHRPAGAAAGLVDRRRHVVLAGRR